MIRKAVNEEASGRRTSQKVKGRRKEEAKRKRKDTKGANVVLPTYT